MTEPLADEPFSYQNTKDGRVFLRFKGKTIKTLASREGVKFLQKVEGASVHEAQLLMARVTKHFKHGNER